MQIVILGAMLLLPAGTWDWPRAIQFLVAYGLVLTITVCVLARIAPGSASWTVVDPHRTRVPLHRHVRMGGVHTHRRFPVGDFGPAFPCDLGRRILRHPSNDLPKLVRDRGGYRPIGA